MSCGGVGDYFSNVVSSPILSKVMGSCYRLGVVKINPKEARM